jgi:hypothetical protein
VSGTESPPPSACTRSSADAATFPTSLFSMRQTSRSVGIESRNAIRARESLLAAPTRQKTGAPRDRPGKCALGQPRVADYRSESNGTRRAARGDCARCERIASSERQMHSGEVRPPRARCLTVR